MKHAWDYTLEEFLAGPDYMRVSRAIQLVPGSKYLAVGDYTGLTEEQARLIQKAEQDYADWQAMTEEADRLVRDELLRLYPERKYLIWLAPLTWDEETYKFLLEIRDKLEEETA